MNRAKPPPSHGRRVGAWLVAGLCLSAASAAASVWAATGSLASPTSILPTRPAAAWSDTDLRDARLHQWFEQGRHAELVELLERRLDEPGQARADLDRWRLLLARTLAEQGHPEAARDHLASLLRPEHSMDDAYRARALLLRAMLDLPARRYDGVAADLADARRHLSFADLAPPARLAIEAELLLVQSRLAAVQGDEPRALAHRASITQLVARPDTGQSALDAHVDAALDAGQASVALSGLPDDGGASLRRLEQWLRLSALLLAAEHSPRDEARARLALERAEAMAVRLDNPFAFALVLGRQAQALLRLQDWDGALRRARRAIFASQAWPTLRYQWEWVAARALRQQGHPAEAIEQYRVAAQTLDGLRQAGAAPIAFALSGRLPLELADMLLQSADRDDGAAAALIHEARQRIEQSKAAELRDYFQDDCVTELQARITSLEQLPQGVAALYPIVFDDRLELLLTIGQSTVRRTVAIDRERFSDQVDSFRELLEQRTNRRFLRPARQLHRWLIAPVQDLLAAQRVNELIVIPEGALRTVPLAALHDGERFLVERFALSVTPGLSLTDSEPFAKGPRSALVAGVGEAVQGFAALGNVESEIEQVHRLTGGRKLLDAQFSRQVFVGEMRATPHSVVHVASHAQFAANPDRTFVLTHDDRITLQELAGVIGAGRFRQRPLELLTLSACETAAGDDRAALGLAGAAVRSGARSVLASLWPVDDRASAELLGAFYDALFARGLGKAAALRQAQLRLLSDRRYVHPAYWAVFTLIGNGR